MACLLQYGKFANPEVLHGEPVIWVRSSYEMIEINPSSSCEDLPDSVISILGLPIDSHTSNDL